MIAEAMHRLLQVLDGSGVEAFGTAHGNGTVQLTLKGLPEATEQILDRWFDALLPDDLEEA